MLGNHDNPTQPGPSGLSAAVLATLRRHGAATRLRMTDVRQMETHLRQCEASNTVVLGLVGEILRRKLAHCQIVEEMDVPLELAIGNSLIRYRIGDNEPRSGLLHHRVSRQADTGHLSVCSLAGATVIGLSAGESARLLRSDFTFGTITLLEVISQPTQRLSPAGRRLWR